MPVRVFLADDHAVVRDGLRLILGAEKDFDVVGDAENGREAVRRASELKPDVVVMDISMPELNGIEATRQMIDAIPATSVVILSIHMTAEHVFRALKAGAIGYLLKESAGDELVKAVRTVSVGKRYFSEKIVNVMTNEYLRRLRETHPEQSPLERLSGREREILQLVVEGNSSEQIGKTIHLSRKTVETYRSRLMQKLAIDNVPALVKFAIVHGLTSPE